MSMAVTISDVSAMDALVFKAELARDGLVMNQDYAWRYCPVKYNHDWSTIPIEQSRVVFEFSSPALASFYRVKWAK
jgi:hypothetical protein